MSATTIISRAALVLTILALAAVPVALPMLGSPFWIDIVAEILIWSLLAASVNLLLGYVGLLSFGQALYFGIGMYGAALSFIGGPDSGAVSRLGSSRR
jgi:branched-chain amino acid transport system permease protein